MSFHASRRSVLTGALGATIASLPLGSRMVFAATGSKEPIIWIMLRGGMDGLNLVSPVDDANLRAARSVGIIPTTGFQLANGLTNQDWRLHPSAPELNALYKSGKLAIVHAAGMPFDSRSHFEMQQLTETGQLDLTKVVQLGGWLGRYALDTAVSGTFAVGAYGIATPPTSINNDYAALDLASAGSYRLSSAVKQALLTRAYATPVSPSSSIDVALTEQVRDLLSGVTTFAGINTGYVVPAGYGSDNLSTGLAIVAELLKARAGLQIGALEYDNWDTHTSQASRFPPSVAIVSKALGAFWNDISAAGVKATVIVVSEFGRRIAGNASGGTDHGHGNAMLVLGSSVNGGRMYGNWPGLAPAQTDSGDVAITTDSRAVFLEAITKRRGDAPAGLFPSLANSAPLGIFTAG